MTSNRNPVDLAASVGAPMTIGGVKRDFSIPSMPGFQGFTGRNRPSSTDMPSAPGVPSLSAKGHNYKQPGPGQMTNAPLNYSTAFYIPDSVKAQNIRTPHLSFLFAMYRAPGETKTMASMMPGVPTGYTPTEYFSIGAINCMQDEPAQQQRFASTPDLSDFVNTFFPYGVRISPEITELMATRKEYTSTVTVNGVVWTHDLGYVRGFASKPHEVIWVVPMRLEALDVEEQRASEALTESLTGADRRRLERKLATSLEADDADYLETAVLAAGTAKSKTTRKFKANFVVLVTQHGQRPAPCLYQNRTGFGTPIRLGRVLDVRPSATFTQEESAKHMREYVYPKGSINPDIVPGLPQVQLQLDG